MCVEKLKMILKPRFQVQKAVVWAFLRSRYEIAHVVIWQLKHTSVLRAGAPRTQPIFRVHQVFKPWECTKHWMHQHPSRCASGDFFVKAHSPGFNCSQRGRRGSECSAVLSCFQNSHSFGARFRGVSSICSSLPDSLKIPGGSWMGQHLVLL